MSKEKIKTIAIFVLSGIIILFIGIFFGMNLNKNNVEKTPNDDIVEEVKEPTIDEVLTSLTGEWGMCYGEYDCRGILIGKNDTGEYYYTPYVMWSEFGDKGTIKSTEKEDNNKYKLTVYFAGYEDELGSAPERTLDYTIDISEISEHNLYVGTVKYQLINGDRESFFRSIMS